MLAPETSSQRVGGCLTRGGVHTDMTVWSPEIRLESGEGSPAYGLCVTKIPAMVLIAFLGASCSLFESPAPVEFSDDIDGGEPVEMAADAAAIDTGGLDATFDTGKDDPGRADASMDAAQDADSDAADGGEKDAGSVAIVPFGHQPAAHTTIAETGFADVPDGPNFDAHFGYWDLLPSYPQSDLEAATDNEAFLSGPNVMRVIMPAGLGVDRRQWYIEGWRDDLPVSDEVYQSMTIKLEGTDWENNAGGVMFTFFSYASTSNPRSERRIQLEIVPEPSRADAFALRVRTAEWPGGATISLIEQNIDNAKRLTVGEWHQVELLARLNTPDVADGIIEVWIDGHHVISQSTVPFRSLDAPGPFFYFLVFNEWLGPGTARDSADSFLLDHLRISADL